jgi:hypothetical protein
MNDEELEDTIIPEDTGVGDVAMQPGRLQTKPDSECRGKACFDIEDSHAFHGMMKGVKTKFKHWRTVTNTPKISDWSKDNPKQDFYIHNKGNYILVRRKK